MAGFTSREIRLKQRPNGAPVPGDFEEASVDVGAPGDGEILVRNLWMSVDPYMRGRMSDRKSYVPPFEIGKAMDGGAVGEVVTSNDPKFAPGDLVLSMMGWREGFVAKGSALDKLPRIPGVPDQAYLGVLGMPGMTAYGGFLELGQPKEGDTVFVSGAAGAVGSTVCQIAKLKGCHVVGSAGSDEKAAWLKGLGVDHVVNYRTAKNLGAAVAEGAPKGIDVYFDNVGGEHLEVAIELARPGARLVECGMISAYNDTQAAPGPRNMMMIVGKSLTIRGFIVTTLMAQHPGLMDRFRAEMGQWVANGQIKWEETVEDGIGNAPAAFLKLFSGGNTGKMLVRL